MSTYSRESCALLENTKSGTSPSPLPFNRLKTFEIQHVIIVIVSVIITGERANNKSVR